MRPFKPRPRMSKPPERLRCASAAINAPSSAHSENAPLSNESPAASMPPNRIGRQPRFGTTRQPGFQSTARSRSGDHVAYFAVTERPGKACGTAQIDAADALRRNRDADVEFVGGDARAVGAPIAERQCAIGFERRVRRPIQRIEQKGRCRRAAARKFERNGAVHGGAWPLRHQRGRILPQWRQTQHARRSPRALPPAR